MKVSLSLGKVTTNSLEYYESYFIEAEDRSLLTTNYYVVCVFINIHLEKGGVGHEMQSACLVM